MKKYKLLIIVVIPILFFSSFNVASAVSTPSEGVSNYTLNTPIGELKTIGPKNTDSLGKYIQVWYGFLIGIAGILATLMIMFAGVKWMTSRGDTGAIGESKQIMIAALTGLALAFLSYSILALINPGLLTIKMAGLAPVGYTGKFNFPTDSLGRPINNTATSAANSAPNTAPSNTTIDRNTFITELAKNQFKPTNSDTVVQDTTNFMAGAAQFYDLIGQQININDPNNLIFLDTLPISTQTGGPIDTPFDNSAIFDNYGVSPDQYNIQHINLDYVEQSSHYYYSAIIFTPKNK